MICTYAIKMYTNNGQKKILQKTCTRNCESEVNYIVDHTSNVKQQIVNCSLKCLNWIEKC